ncbi:MAG: TlpA family protein disulfide reductase [Magnetospiraceae bacterium]
MVKPLFGVFLAGVIGFGSTNPSQAGELAMDDRVPHLDEGGQTGYRDFLQSGAYRAFAIAPGGAWAWYGDALSDSEARQEALAYCADQTDQSCVLYAVNDQRVFEEEKWPTLWGPYAHADSAAAAPIGTRRGQRFPDLAFTNPDGESQTLSALQGKVTIVHFWGSWCTPCQVEFPEMQALFDDVGGNVDIKFVLLQSREPISKSRRWAARMGTSLPLSDSGTMGAGDAQFSASDGTSLPDRTLAPVFPSTYVLDKHGIVVHAQIGPTLNWPEYAPFLEDAAKKSGR